MRYVRILQSYGKLNEFCYSALGAHRKERGGNMGHKLPILHPGGIAVVSTPNMEYMAQVAYNELLGRIKRKSIDFHVMEYRKFSRGEVLPIVKKNVRRKDVYLFYDFNGDAPHDAFVLQLTISALQDAGAEHIIVVMPYIPFLRQDRKDRSRVPISAKDFIDGYERYEKVERTITLDMHADQTQMGFRKRSDVLPGHVIFVPWIMEHYRERLNKLVVVGPDAGSVKRVTAIAKRVGCKRAFFVKDREGTELEILECYGADVRGMDCLLSDDILDTCTTAIKASERLMELGAKSVTISGTHAVFGDKNGTTALEKLTRSGFQVVVTDSLRTKSPDWLTVLPLGEFMGHAILQNIIEGGSVSEIIEDGLPS